MAPQFDPFVKPAHFRLAHLRHWWVNITPWRVDSLPYSKIKAVSNTYRQRLVASRKAPVTSTALPTSASFICQPTPSYVFSSQLASRLSKPEFSSLASRLRVYETVPVPIDGDEELEADSEELEVDFDVEEQDCTPEVIIEPALGGGDQALYYGHGQLHVIGMLDMHSAEVKENVQFSSASDLQRLLASELLGNLKNDAEFDDASSFLYCNTKEGRKQIARVSADVDYTEDVATASITLNLAVPTPGLDPDRTCPYNRLAAIGVESPVTSEWALGRLPASDQFRPSGALSPSQMSSCHLVEAVQTALGIGPFPMLQFADHSRALGASDPDLMSDDQEGPFWA